MGSKLYFAIVVREEGNFLSESTLRIQKSKFWREVSSKMRTRIKCFGQQAYTSLDRKELQYLQENKILCESIYHNTSNINGLKPSYNVFWRAESVLILWSRLWTSYRDGHMNISILISNLKQMVYVLIQVYLILV